MKVVNSLEIKYNISNLLRKKSINEIKMLGLFLVLSMFLKINSQLLAVALPKSQYLLKKRSLFCTALNGKLESILSSISYVTFYEREDDTTFNVTSINALHGSLFCDIPYTPFKKHYFVYSPKQMNFQFVLELQIHNTTGIYSKTLKLEHDPYSLIIEEDEGAKNNVNVILNYGPDTYICEVEATPREKDQICSFVKNNFMKNNEAILIKAMKKSIETTTIQSFSTIYPLNITTSSPFNYTRLQVIREVFGTCETESESNETNMICYFLGQVERKDFSDKKEDAKRDDFIKNNGLFKIFLHNELISQIIKASELVPLTNENKPETLIEYKLNVNLLSYFFHDITLYYKGETLITIFSTFKDVEVQNGEIRGNLICDVKVKKEDIMPLFKFSAKISSKFFSKRYTSTFNLCTNKTLTSIYSFKIIQTNIGKMENTDKFYSLVRAVIASSKNELCLFNEDGFELFDYIKLAEKVDILDKGIYIEGPAMFYDSKDN